MHSQQPPGVVQNWSTLQCSKQNNEQCGYDHAPVTRGCMRAQFPLPHGPPFMAAPPPPTKPPPAPHPPPALKVVREWEGVGVWPVATAPPFLRQKEQVPAQNSQASQEGVI